ncbi:MAG TPA: hypothetical protein ENN56_03650, partial [Firmicutes bacterium]|nr:hypothetical protein [Bacillota bacterium]
GIPYHPTERDAVEAVRQVALLHRVPVDTIPREWSGWYRAIDTRRLIPETIDRMRSIGTANGEVEAFLDTELAFDPETDAPDPVPVHGDLWRGNWVADRGHIAALTDFDWLHRGSPMEDLADVILAFASNRDVSPDDAPLVEPPNAVLTDRVVLMLREYECVRGSLSSESRRLMPDMLRSLWLRHTAWIVRELDSPLHLQIALARAMEFRNWFHEVLPTVLRQWSEKTD